MFRLLCPFGSGESTSLNLSMQIDYIAFVTYTGSEEKGSETKRFYVLKLECRSGEEL